MDGTIIKISRFCNEDGPGIRTTVFLKGCPLRCVWCHNPESQRKEPELWYDKSKCVKCTKCSDVCENACHSFNTAHTVDLEKCTACGKCAAVCPTNALEIIGKIVSAEYVLKEIEKDTVFYKNSGGGVTISGGEPLFQSAFTSEILKLCKEKGIHTAIETSGFSSSTALKEVLKYCDLVLFDIKETDLKLHKKFTNAEFTPIIENLNTVNSMKIPFIIRMPVIPEFNDRAEHFDAVKKIAKAMKYCKDIQIMPYHSMGEYKYALLQREYICKKTAEPNKELTERWRNIIKN